MNAPSRAGLVLGSIAAATLLVACSRDLTVPEAGPPRFAAAAGTDSVSMSDSLTTSEAADSVAAGYGNEATGGICHQTFEYDPATGTEYVITSDCSAAEKELQAAYPDPAATSTDP